MDEHHGYLVRAFAPDSALLDEDRFETRAGAIDCARLLAERGRLGVQCFAIIQRQDESEESLEIVNYLPLVAPRRRVWTE